MNAKPPISEKNITIISLAFLVDTFVYAAIMYFLKDSIKPSLTLEINNQLYLLCFIIGGSMIATIRPLREKIWEARKGSITSVSMFCATMMVMTMLAMGTVDAIGIGGLLIFFLTGNVKLPMILLALSFAGKLFYFPGAEEINNRKQQINFLS